MTDTAVHASDRRTRLWASLACAVSAAVIARGTILSPDWPTDFDQLWHAARAVLRSQDAYSVVGPESHRILRWDWPLFFPLPAVVLTLPLAFLPVAVARLAFAATSGAVLGWSLGPRIRSHWPVVLSASFIIATARGQWSPLLLAATWAPVWGFVIAAKPTVGLAALASFRDRQLIVAVSGCIAITLLSFLVQPDWVARWLEAIDSAPNKVIPLLTLPAGPLLGLAALRWRRPDARLFLLFAIIPHTPSLYDLVLLFFVCRNLRETLALALLTQVLFWGVVSFNSFTSFDSYAKGLAQATVVVVYLPILIALLFRHNVGTDPAPDVSAPSAGKIGPLPTNWGEAILLALLLVGGALQIILPFVKP